MLSKRRYPRHRFPIDVVCQCGWLYVRFSLSDCDVELMMAECDLTVGYEIVRRWCDKFGCEYPKRLRRCRADSA